MNCSECKNGVYESVTKEFCTRLNNGHVLNTVVPLQECKIVVV